MAADQVAERAVAQAVVAEALVRLAQMELIPQVAVALVEFLRLLLSH